MIESKKKNELEIGKKIKYKKKQKMAFGVRVAGSQWATADRLAGASESRAVLA